MKIDLQISTSGIHLYNLNEYCTKTTMFLFQFL